MLPWVVCSGSPGTGKGTSEEPRKTTRPHALSVVSPKPRMSHQSLFSETRKLGTGEASDLPTQLAGLLRTHTAGRALETGQKRPLKRSGPKIPVSQSAKWHSDLQARVGGTQTAPCPLSIWGSPRWDSVLECKEQWPKIDDQEACSLWHM